MNLTAETVRWTYLAAAAFYAAAHALMAWLQRARADAAWREVPEPARALMSLAQHRLAVDFQKKAVAADWLAAMAGLAVALGLTLGGGLNWCWAAAASLWGAGPAGQCALAAGVMLALAAADLLRGGRT